MINFHEYLNYILPPWFFNNGYLQKLTTTLTFPFDVTLQAFDYIPRLREAESVGDVDLDYLAFERRFERVYGEPAYRDRLKQAFDYWREAGSRKMLSEILIAAGYNVDLYYPGIQDSEYPQLDGYYGIKENVDTNASDAYWYSVNDPQGTYPDPKTLTNPGNKGMVWGHWVWGGKINVWTKFAVYIIDPTNEVFSSNDRIKGIISICNEFCPANTHIRYIYRVGALHNILNTVTVNNDNSFTIA